MAKAFDPYHAWLGIRPDEQPPHHYRLLGLGAFEDSAEAIEHAADQRMAHLRSFQTGKRAELSQRLLNEVAAARVCLLSAQKKASYDEQLRGRLQTDKPPAPPRHESVEPELSALFQQTGTAGAATRVPTGGKAPSRRFVVLLGSLAAALLIGGLILWASTSQDTPVGGGCDGDQKAAIDAVPTAPPPLADESASPSPEPKELVTAEDTLEDQRAAEEVTSAEREPTEVAAERSPSVRSWMRL